MLSRRSAIWRVGSSNSGFFVVTMSKPYITDQFAKSTGRVVIQSAYLEFAFRELIEKFLNGEGTACVTSDLTFANLHHLAKALGHRLLKSDLQLEKYNKIMSRAKNAYDVECSPTCGASYDPI